MPYYPTIVETFGEINNPGTATTAQYSGGTVAGETVAWGTIAGAVSYALSGTDAASFNIVESTGVVTWAITPPNVDDTYVFVVEGTDAEGDTTYQSVILSSYAYNIGQVDGIYVLYEVGVEGSDIDFPEQWIDPQVQPPVSPPTTYSAHKANLKEYVGGVYRIQQKVPTNFTSNPIEFMNVDTFVSQDFSATQYSTPDDRVIAYGDDLAGNNEIGFGRWLDFRLDCIGLDIDGRPDWYSQINSYYTSQNSNNGTVDPQLLAIEKAETVTVTFNGFDPPILGTSPNIDQDLIVQLIRKDGNGNVVQTVTCDKNNLSNINISATYPETITIHVEGNYTRLLFPNETWTYAFDKSKDYTIIPEHLPVLLDSEGPRLFDPSQLLTATDVTDEVEELTVGTETGNEITVTYFSATKLNELAAASGALKVLPQDPNEVFDAYQIDQTYSNQSRINGIVFDLSQEFPTDAEIIKYEQDQVVNRDVTYTFTVTSSMPAWNSAPWAAGTYAVGDYVTNDGNLYRVILAGTATLETGPPIGTTNYRGTVSVGVPPVETPSGPVYRYIPDPIGSGFGAATIQLRQNVLNNYINGQVRYSEILDSRPNRRDPKPNTLEEPPRTDGF